MSRVIENTAFPSAMEAKLQRIRWRQAGLAVVRAIAIGASVLIVAMLAAMLADWWLTLFDTRVRTAMTVTSLSLAVAVFLMAAVRPVMDALVWTRAANEADAEVPQLEERWTTISHFAKSKHQPGTAVAKAMLEQVTSEAVALGSLVEPARVVRAARLHKVLIVAGASAAVLIGFLAVNWQQNAVLLRRFWAPTAPITATQLESVTGDVAIPRGQKIDLVTRLTGLERAAATLMLVTESDESDSIVLPCNPDAPETFKHRVDVEESFRYRVRAGDGQTEWHSITAIDPPEISDVRLTVTAPDYVDRPPYEKTMLPGRIKAIQGSRLTLEMRSAAELERFELQLVSGDESGESVERTLTLAGEADGWYRFETLLEEDLSLSPTLFSPYGLTNEERRICRIRVIPDKAPVARVISPTEDMTVSADDVLEIKFEAHDDHGIAKAELVVSEENENGEQEVLAVQEIPLGDKQFAMHLLATTKLDLSKFDLEEGKNISYAVRVTDNRMLNLNPEDVAARKSKGNETAESDAEKGDAAKSEAKKMEGESADPASIAEVSDARESSEIPESPDQTATARNKPASENEPPEDPATESSKTSEEAPDETHLAKADAASASKESPKVGLRIGDTEPKAAIAAADAKADTKADAETTADTQAEGSQGDEKSTTKPDDPTSVANSKSDAPMPADDSEPTGEKVAASKSDPAGAAKPNAPEGDEKPESPAVAAASAKPAEDAEGKDAKPSGGSPNPQSPTNATPQVAQSGGGSPRRPDEDKPQGDPIDKPVDPEAPRKDGDPKPHSGSVQLSLTPRAGSSNPMPPRDLKRDMKFEAQLGQNTLSNRMRLRIADRLAVAAKPGSSRKSDAMNTRELLQKIDKELEAGEATLSTLHEQPDASEVPEKSKDVDSRFEKAELIVADLRNDTKETKYAFVGLQMLDIGRTHLTPARDRMFVLIQDPGSNPARNILEALHHTSATRELIAALTKQFEAVARERELAEDLEEVAKMYEVYVENMQGVLREAQQNKNPLQRKMAVIEVDEAYLERYAEILEMRREIMAEFARILADDPRLMGKFMDLFKRRGNSLRDQLTDLHERQEQIAYELSGWLRVDEAQRPDVWIQVAEMRLLAVNDLVKEASQLESRTLTQLPLNLEQNAGISGQIVEHAKEVALNARQSSIKARQLMSDALDNDEAKAGLVQIAGDLVYELAELDAVLQQLSFKKQGEDEIEDFTTKRLAESRGVAEQALAWLEIAAHVRHDRFHGLAGIDQHKLAVDTDRLRIAMATIENDLSGLFRPDDVPNEIVNIVRELLIEMERITFNQAAATFELSNDRLEQAEAQQTMAAEGFARAEELFDKMRRRTTAILDERAVNNPNIADLQDPTLDEFLARLEREPDLRQLLGIPNRPSNLRVIQDWLVFQGSGGGGGGGSEGEGEGSAGKQAAANAMKRAQMLAQRRMDEEQKQRPAANENQLTEEEMKKFAEAEDMEGDMEKMLKAIEERMNDPATGDKQRQDLHKKAEMLAQMLAESRGGSLNRQKWEELVKTDEMKAMMEALAKGEAIPDSQWNRLLSTLDTGLWQVRGRTPPEDYRKAIEQYQDQIRRLLNAESVDAN